MIPIDPKIIPFPGMDLTGEKMQSNTARDCDNIEAEAYDAYIDRLQNLSRQLKQAAEIFDIPTKEVLSDLTYIFVGADIIDHFADQEGHIAGTHDSRKA